MADWSEHAARLAEQLNAAGKLCSPEWQAAIRDVPRHVLVPVYYEQDRTTGEWHRVNTGDPDRYEQWLDLAYSNSVLVTKVGPLHGPWGTVEGALSSTSMPGLVTRMLEALDVHDGQRVLEIGTGTGYNAALLCHRLGDHNVFSVDIEDDLVAMARERLARLDYHPVLAVADGADGLAEHAPYDRIIATCAVPAVPWAWIEQTAPGGLILVDVKPTLDAGNLLLLRRHDNRAEGRFEKTWAGFMTIRHAQESCEPEPASFGHAGAVKRRTHLPLPKPWEHLAFWFFAQPWLPGPVRHQRLRSSDRPGTMRLTAGDGSWCEISEDSDTGTQTVWEGGPIQLWDAIERAYEQWQQAGRPGWQRFGLTVTPQQQWAWLDQPDGKWRWTLALWDGRGNLGHPGC